MVGPARQPFGTVGSLERPRARQAGPIARWAPSATCARRGSSGAIQQDPPDPSGKGDARRASACRVDGGLRAATRTSSLGNSQGRPCQIQPERTLFVPSGAEAARRASANRAAAEGPSGPFGPSHRLRAAAWARSHAEVCQRGIPEPSGEGSGTGSASAGPEPYGTSSDDPAKQPSSEVGKVCLVTHPGCFSGRPGAAAVPGPQPDRSCGVLGQNSSGGSGIGPSPRARFAAKALWRFHRWSNPSPDGYYQRTHTRVWNPISGPRSAVKAKDKEAASAAACGCVARATVPASVGSEAAGACGQEGQRLRTTIGQTAPATEPTGVFGQWKARSQPAEERPRVFGQKDGRPRPAATETNALGRRLKRSRL